MENASDSKKKHPLSLYLRTLVHNTNIIDEKWHADAVDTLCAVYSIQPDDDIKLQGIFCEVAALAAIVSARSTFYKALGEDIPPLSKLVNNVLTSKTASQDGFNKTISSETVRVISLYKPTYQRFGKSVKSFSGYYFSQKSKFTDHLRRVFSNPVFWISPAHTVAPSPKELVFILQECLPTLYMPDEDVMKLYIDVKARYRRLATRAQIETVAEAFSAAKSCSF
eukprot:jgi/Bigna1/78892/fgenesh1_pg.58_\